MADFTNNIIFNLVGKNFDKVGAQIRGTFSAIKQGVLTTEGAAKSLSSLQAKRVLGAQQAGKAEAAALAKSISARQKILVADSSLANKSKALADIMKRSGATMGEVNQVMSKLGLSFNKTGKVVDIFGKKVRASTKNLKIARIQIKQFRGDLLSLLFGFQMVSRGAQMFLRAALTSYNKASDEQSEFAKGTNKLIAAWEFFKFSMIDALANSDLFLTLVDFVFQLVNAVNEFLATPFGEKIKEIFPMIVLFAGILATVLSVLAGLGLLVIGLEAFIATMPAVIGFLSPLFAFIAANFLIIAGIVAIVVALWVTDFAGFRDVVKVILGEVFAIIKNVFIALIAIVKTIFAIIVAIFEGDWDKVAELTKKLVFIIIKLFIQVLVSIIKIGNRLSQFSVDLAISILSIFVKLVNFILRAFIDLSFGIMNSFVAAFSFILDLAISFINKLLSVFSKIPGVSALLRGAKAGLEGLKSVTDSWGNSLNSARNTLLSASKIGDTLVNNLRDSALGATGRLGEGARAAVSGLGDSALGALKGAITVNNVEIGPTTIEIPGAENLNVDELVDKINEKQDERIERLLGSTNI